MSNLVLFNHDKEWKKQDMGSTAASGGPNDWTLLGGVNGSL